MQYCATLSEVYQGIGTPLEVAERYQLFPKEFFASLSGPDRFMYDIATLSEHQRIQAEERKRDKKKSEDERQHPGMVRNESEEEFWESTK